MGILGILIISSTLLAGELVDRIIATVDGHAITLSELNRAVLTGTMTRETGENDGQFRSRVLSEMIDEYLRLRDALRFSPVPPAPAQVNAQMDRLKARLRAEGRNADDEFRRAGLSEQDVRLALTRQMIVTQYVDDRFASVAFISAGDIAARYEGPFSERLRREGKPIPPLTAVEEDLRKEIQSERTAQEIEKWTADLRSRARITYEENPAAPAGQPVVLSRLPAGKGH